MTIFLNDRDLLRDFREGHRWALERVYWAYVDKIERIVRFGFVRGDSVLLSGVGNAPAELRDLVHEVFTKTFAPDARRAYDGLRPFGPYLYAIARNVLADWGRRAGREVPTEGPFIEAALEVAEPEEAPAYADERTVAIVERFIRELPDDLRALHEKRSIAGLSQREAAEALGITRQVLRTRETRLRDMLRERLACEDRPAQDGQPQRVPMRPVG
jgi:RNA polymerase sigma-70 factor (ECF subfamily)